MGYESNGCSSILCLPQGLRFYLDIIAPVDSFFVFIRFWFFGSAQDRTSIKDITGQASQFAIAV